MSTSIVDVVERTIASGKSRIPVLDNSAARAHAMLAEESPDPNELEELVETDPALTSGVLRVANSSFFRGLEPVVGIREAIVRLGARKICQLVVVMSQERSFQVRDPELRKMAAVLWKHSVACGLGAEWLARRLKLGAVEHEAMLAGLLHDVGKLFVLIVIDGLKHEKPGFDPPAEMIAEVTQALHCIHGEKLMQSWSVPEVYQRVVRRHHEEEIDESDLLLLTVRLADAVCNRIGIALVPDPSLEAAATVEAQVLRVSDVVLAELEVTLEDAAELAG
jgi:HD-like signal output (HDOD) protein